MLAMWMDKLQPLGVQAQVSEVPKVFPKWTFGRPMRQSAGIETEKQIANSKKENWKFTNWNSHESELRFAFQNRRGGRWQRHQIQLDSGAEIIVIDKLSHELIGSPRLRKCTESGCMFDGTQVKFIGKGVANFKLRDIYTKSEYYVAKRGSLNLLSVQMMDAFGLLNELKAKINAPAHLILKADAAPIYRKARPVPYNAQEAIDGELERWEKMGVFVTVVLHLRLLHLRLHICASTFAPTTFAPPHLRLHICAPNIYPLFSLIFF
ncbi:hypothetical protein niasHT_010698 [Heterodera trifolii]|uniref:Peptidase A2 domain-containing protein n=1 Tax=Heterodera trifolii TaxID=157864 RepID=A0ABD2LA06_9BILA